MVKIRDFTPMLHEHAKSGYRDDAVQLIHNLIWALKDSRDLKETEKSYLLECLQRTIKLDDANKGFYLSLGRGKKRKNTLMRDYLAAEIMTLSEGSDLKYDDRLSEAVKEINKNFPEAPADKKTVEKAYTDYKEAVLINHEM